MDSVHQLYINLIEYIPVGLVVWQLNDLDDVSTFQRVAINPIARQILGLPLTEPSSPRVDSTQDPFPAFLKTEPPEVYANIIRKQTARDLGEIRYRNEQAIEKIFLVKAFPLPNQQVGVMLEDITERKHTEETLSQLERKLLFHLQQTPLAVIEWDLNFRVIGWNPAAEKIFGFSRREALGRHATQLILPDYLHEEIGQLWRKLVTSKSSITNTNANLRGNGKTIMCEWHSTPLINENGQVESVLSIAQDITDRKRTEEELWQFATRLEQSNRELQDFAFVASHDLQEPLRKIQAFGDRLKTKYADTLPEEGQDYISRMQVASKRMQTLINDLLMLSRVTTNAHPFSPVNLNQVVQEVLSDLEIRIHQGGAAIEVSELPVIEADPLQMRQLLQNLISNALKFHQPDTTPIIRIQAQLFPYAPADFPMAPSHSSAYSVSGASSLPPLCQLRVIDNGIGFDEKHLSRIFTVFNRLHGRNEYEGTGIGLAICRKIVERHRGHITARSTPGQGATFIVTLPTIQSTSSLA